MGFMLRPVHIEPSQDAACPLVRHRIRFHQGRRRVSYVTTAGHTTRQLPEPRLAESLPVPHHSLPATSASQTADRHPGHTHLQRERERERETRIYPFTTVLAQDIRP